MKVVICTSHSGFNLSGEELVRYAEIKGLTLYPVKVGDNNTLYYLNPPEERQANPDLDHSFHDYNIKRDDPALVQLVEESRAGPKEDDGEFVEPSRRVCPYLKVVEIPDNVNWQISEYDGWEHVAEVHRTWS